MHKSLYTRPQKPLKKPIVKSTIVKPTIDLKSIKAPIVVDKYTECHVTPQDVADRMVEYLGPQGDYLTLEPEAGTGALIDALLRAGHSVNELCYVERHIKLFNNLHYDGAGAINRCFLEWTSEVKGKVQFPRIIMNPPFSKVRAHMAAAISLLGRNGHSEPSCLVALVPVTYKHEDMEIVEYLPNTTFSTAKVNTMLVRIYGP